MTHEELMDLHAHADSIDAMIDLLSHQVDLLRRRIDAVAETDGAVGQIPLPIGASGVVGCEYPLSRKMPEGARIGTRSKR